MTIHFQVDRYDAAVEDAIATSNGDMLGALKALLIVNEHPVRPLKLFGLPANERSTHVARSFKGCRPTQTHKGRATREAARQMPLSPWEPEFTWYLSSFRPLTCRRRISS
jgi:hypothetical protein